MLIVDLLETIQVDEQAREAGALPLRARQFLLQSSIEIAAVVPAGEKVVTPLRTRRARLTVFSIANDAMTPRCAREIRGEVAREATLVGAAEVQAALQSILPRQRNQRDAATPALPGNSSWWSPVVRPEPRSVKGIELRRQRR